MTRRLLAIIVLGTVAVVAVGCGVDGEASRVSSPPTTPASAPGGSGAPGPTTTTAGTTPPTTTTTAGDGPATTTDPTVPATAEIEGVVIAFDGDLTDARWFTIRTADGEDIEFAIADGATFDGGNIGHLRDHLLSGAPVIVTYRRDGGVLVATFTADAH